VLAAELVEPGQQNRWRQPLAIDRNRITALKRNLDIFGLVRGGFGGDSAAEDEFIGLDVKQMQMSNPLHSAGV
jgi:hypothetical protein